MARKEFMDYVPKGKREAVRDLYEDEDGIWLYLNEGFEASRMYPGCRVIHEDTIRELRYQIAGIKVAPMLFWFTDENGDNIMYDYSGTTEEAIQIAEEYKNENPDCGNVYINEGEDIVAVVF